MGCFGTTIGPPDGSVEFPDRTVSRIALVPQTLTHNDAELFNPRPAEEKFPQGLSSHAIAGGGASHRRRMARPLNPLAARPRLKGMDNEHSSDIGRFEHIILPHLDAAHNFARWLVRNTDDAEDVVQEACLRAFRYFGTFRGGNARPWLLRIVRTTSTSWLQRNRRRQLEIEFEEEVHHSAGEDRNPETLLLQRADTELVAQAIRQLPDRLRQVLVLRELESFSYREIAGVVGIPMGTVMSTLSRARERFRHRLSDLVNRQPSRREHGHPGLQTLGVNDASLHRTRRRSLMPHDVCGHKSTFRERP